MKSIVGKKESKKGNRKKEADRKKSPVSVYVLIFVIIMHAKRSK